VGRDEHVALSQPRQRVLGRRGDARSAGVGGGPEAHPRTGPIGAVWRRDEELLELERDEDGRDEVGHGGGEHLRVRRRALVIAEHDGCAIGLGGDAVGDTRDRDGAEGGVAGQGAGDLRLSERHHVPLLLEDPALGQTTADLQQRPP
jgi:hypothetical protein